MLLPQQGTTFNVDSKTVLILLGGLFNSTNGDTWINNIQCGKAVIQALQQHYDGFFESNKRIQEAKHNNENIFYKVETLFSFEEYCTAIKNIIKS